MANPTTNFNWQMPTSSDLVTDLPADFAVFGQAVDTSLADLKGGTTGQVLKKNTNADMDFVWSADSAGMTNPMTTTGDTIYSSSGSTPARLGIGTTGQVLTVSGGLPAWSTPTATGQSFSLLNSGGTALTGAATITVSGISSKGTIYVIVNGASSVSGAANISVRINGVTSSSYEQVGAKIFGEGTWSTSNVGRYALTDDKIYIATMASVATSSAAGYVRIEGAATSGTKMYTVAGSANSSNGNGQAAFIGGGYIATTTVTEISVFSDNGNFDAGTVYVYASA